MSVKKEHLKALQAAWKTRPKDWPTPIVDNFKYFVYLAEVDVAIENNEIYTEIS